MDRKILVFCHPPGPDEKRAPAPRLNILLSAGTLVLYRGSALFMVARTWRMRVHAITRLSYRKRRVAGSVAAQSVAAHRECASKLKKRASGQANAGVPGFHFLLQATHYRKGSFAALCALCRYLNLVIIHGATHFDNIGGAPDRCTRPASTSTSSSLLYHALSPPSPPLPDCLYRSSNGASLPLVCRVQAPGSYIAMCSILSGTEGDSIRKILFLQVSGRI